MHLEHFVKVWLMSSISLAVRNRVWDQVDSASFDRLPEVITNEMDKGGSMQVIANVVNESGKDKVNNQKNNREGRSEPCRELLVWTKARNRRTSPALVYHRAEPLPHHCMQRSTLSAFSLGSCP